MLFTKNFVAVSLINLFVMTAYYLLFVISSPYALERFGAAPSTAGLVAGLMLIGCLTGRFVTGRVIALLGFKMVLFTGLVIYVCGMGLYLAAYNLPFLMGVRFLGGVGVGCIGTATGALIAHIVPPHQHGAGINYFSLSTLLALAFGPFLGIFLLQRVSFAQLFLLCTALGIISFCLALAVSYPVREPAPEGAEKKSPFNLSEYIAPEAVPLAWVVLFTAMGYGSVQAFLSFYTLELNLAGAASLFFLVYAAAAFCLRPFAGRLFDRKGANMVAYPSLIIMACGLFILSRADASADLLLAGALLGAGAGNFQTTAQAACIKLVPKHRFGQATSAYFIFLDFGIGFGPYLFGLLVPLMGYRGLYLATAALTLFCVPLYYLVYGRNHSRRLKA